MPAQRSQSNPDIRLGEPLGYYPARKAGRRVMLALAGVLVFSALLALLYGIWQFGLQLRQYGPVMASRVILWPGLVAGFAWLGSIVLSVVAMRKGNKSLALYQNGFTLRYRGATYSLRWEEVATIKNRITRSYLVGIHSGTHYRYTIEGMDGKELVLDNSIQHVEQAGRVIQQNTFQNRFERVVRQIESGKKIAFGQLLLSREGVRLEDKIFKWGDLQRVEMHGGKLYLIGHAKHAVRVDVIPNPDVLATILVQNVPVRDKM